MNIRSGYQAFKSTPFSVAALTFSVIGCVCLIVALSSPEWLESKPDSNSNFVRLGLWKVCFKQYKHPNLKFDDVFDGCYSLHGHKSETIRDWLQPGWFVFVQCLTTCSTLLSGLCVSILVFMHFQAQVEIKIFVSAFVFVFEALSALLSFLGVCIFGAMCFERSWIQHPKSNTLSLGYAFAAVGALSLACAASLILAQTFRMRRLMYRNNTIMYHVPLPNK